MSQLQAQISEATKTAMKARDKARVAVLRMVNAEFKRIEVDERRELSDDDVIAVLTRMQKQRLDSHTQFVDAGRDDLAAQEAYELELIRDFLPEPLSAEELSALIDEAISSTGASAMGDMGKVMGVLKAQVTGRADMGAVSKTVRDKLSG